jgi:hypothetical protein
VRFCQVSIEKLKEIVPVFKCCSQIILCLFLACTGLGWFVYQSLNQPSRGYSTPDWGSSHWVQAADAHSPVAYFRTLISLDDGLPDSAFVTIAANQVFWLYLNGTLIGSNSSDFAMTGVLKTSMYDVLSVLASGPNILGVRVTNADQGSPLLRVNFGLVRGSTLFSYGSSSNWLATAQSNLVYASTSSSLANAWARKDFIATSWPAATTGLFPARPPLLTLPSPLYEHPSAPWLSAGNEHETYLVASFSLPSSSTVWLRLAALGTAYVYLNGSLILDWQGQPTLSRQRLISYMSGTLYEPQSRNGIPASITPITPYLHSGQNTLAIHVQSPQSSTPLSGLEAFNAAVSLDLLVLNPDIPNQQRWIMPDAHWHISPLPTPNWLYLDQPTQIWPAPLFIARPSTARLFYLPTDMTDRSLAPWTLEPFLSLFLPCCSLFLSLCFLLAWGLKMLSLPIYTLSLKTSLQLTSLATLPALACEGLFSLLSIEPLFPSFYTWPYGLFLLLLFAASYTLLCLTLHYHAHPYSWLTQTSKTVLYTSLVTHEIYSARTQPLPIFTPNPFPTPDKPRQFFCAHLLRLSPWSLVRRHWPILLLVLLTLPLVGYNLSYEPYWQDELSSYYAAQGILTHALPLFPSGFLYEKAELFSYLLALWQLLLGTSASRLLSVLTYLISLPLLYYIGSYFFERRSALLATAMLAFSPEALLWSRQTRMYELAQVLVLLTLFLLCRALEQPRRSRSIYLATASLLAMYLCHEETFIALPGFLLAICLCSYSPGHLLPIVCYQRHWWLSTLFAVAVIALQLGLTRVTHPPTLGTDSSQRPMVQLSFDNVPYYLRLLLFPFLNNKTALPDIALNTLLALGGMLLALRQKRMRARFCSLFFLGSLACLLLLFTMRAERYLYPLLPVYYLLAASLLLHILSALWHYTCSLVPSSVASNKTSLWPVFHPVRLLSTATFSLIIITLLLLPTLPLSNYNLFVSRLFNLSYYHHYPDYDAAGRYLQAHWRSGDVLISIAPDFPVFYYSGHADYFLSIDRALFLLERDGHAIDTSLGAFALFQQSDLLAVLSKHQRIWIVSDDSVYQAQAAKRFSFPDDVHLVFEGYGSAVYLRGS